MEFVLVACALQVSLHKESGPWLPVWPCNSFWSVIKARSLMYTMCLLLGPFPGPTHDSTAARQLQLDQMMVEHCSFEGFR